MFNVDSKGLTYQSLTDEQVAYQWYSVWAMSLETSHWMAHAQLQLGYGRVDPVLLTTAQWAECDRYVKTYIETLV